MLCASNFYLNFKHIKILKNKAMRLIGGYIEGEHDITACFKKLHELNVGQLREYQVGIFAYQCWNNVRGFSRLFQ